jgi:RNA polymerase sigma-32 factor
MTTQKPTDAISAYLKSIGRFKVFSRSEEREVAERYQAGDQSARDQLINHNLRLVVSIAKRFFGYARSGKLCQLDIVQAGNIGLIKAVDKFEPQRGFRLSTCATWWIRAEIQRMVTINMSVVTLRNTGAKKLFFRIQDVKEINDCLCPEEKEKLRAQLLRKVPSISQKELREAEEVFYWNDVSTNASVQKSDKVGITILENLLEHPDDDYQSQEERQFFHQHLYEAMKALSHRERVLLEERWLGEDQETLEIVGDIFGVTRERVRQIEGKAFNKIRARIGVDATQIEIEQLGLHGVVREKTKPLMTT